METFSLKYRDIFLYLYINPAINDALSRQPTTPKTEVLADRQKRGFV